MKKCVLILLIVLTLVNIISFNDLSAYNKKHFEILNMGPEVWEKWRQKYPAVKPDLSKIIIDYDITGLNFSNVNFKASKFINSKAFGVNFNNSDFSFALFKNYKTSNLLRWGVLSFFQAKFFKTKIIKCRLAGVYNKTEFNHSFIKNTLFYSEDDKFYFNCSFLYSRIFSSNLAGKFKNCNFSHANINSSMIAVLYNLNINNNNINILNVLFVNSKFINSTIDFKGKAKNINFTNADLTNSKIGKGTLINVNFTNANLNNTDLTGNTFKNVIFKNADMRGAKVSRKYYNYIKRQGVRNFNKIKWID